MDIMNIFTDVTNVSVFGFQSCLLGLIESLESFKYGLLMYQFQIPILNILIDFSYSTMIKW